ncbi:MAG TPA: hypothetical protein VNW06_05660 [Cytophagaceae bacterium]|jgi:hypothetical protein|nr:hypothetical protein [Cytophagaceae bacterium]
MKYSSLLFLLFINFCACQQSENKTNSTADNTLQIDSISITTIATPVLPEDETWEGFMNGKIGIKLHLYKHDSLLFGELTYKRKGLPITVIGKVMYDGGYNFNEYNKSEIITGVYYLNKDSNNATLTGTWNRAGDDSEILNVVLKKQQDTDTPPSPLGKVDGQYGYNAGNPGSGSFFVESLPDDSLYFYFKCLGPGPGADIAVVKAKGILENNVMTYFFLAKDKSSCGVTIKFVPGGAVVSQIGSSGSCGFARVSDVEGIYYKMNNTIPDVGKMESNR